MDYLLKKRCSGKTNTKSCRTHTTVEAVRKEHIY